MKMLERKGPIWLPCGTPKVTSICQNKESLTLTRVFLLPSQFNNSLRKLKLPRFPSEPRDKQGQIPWRSPYQSSQFVGGYPRHRMHIKFVVVDRSMPTPCCCSNIAWGTLFLLDHIHIILSNNLGDVLKLVIPL